MTPRGHWANFHVLVLMRDCFLTSIASLHAGCFIALARVFRSVARTTSSLKLKKQSTSASIVGPAGEVQVCSIVPSQLSLRRVDGFHVRLGRSEVVGNLEVVMCSLGDG